MMGVREGKVEVAGRDRQRQDACGHDACKRTASHGHVVAYAIILPYFFSPSLVLPNQALRVQ